MQYDRWAKEVEADAGNVPTGWWMGRLCPDGPMCACTPSTPIMYDPYDMRKLALWLMNAAEHIENKEQERKRKES